MTPRKGGRLSPLWPKSNSRPSYFMAKKEGHI
jgi:hypothetical protein